MEKLEIYKIALFVIGVLICVYLHIASMKMSKAFEPYRVLDECTLLEYSGTRAVVKYESKMYELELEEQVDFMELGTVPITIRVNRRSNNSLYCSITKVGDFSVVRQKSIDI